MLPIQRAMQAYQATMNLNLQGRSYEKHEDVQGRDYKKQNEQETKKKFERALAKAMQKNEFKI